jgi:uncharacterized protein
VPEYLAPGVFVEEVSFRSKSIEGVSTSTTAFVGPTRRGPIALPADDGSPGPLPELLTSFLDYQRIYGGFENLTFGTTVRPNYIAHAVRAYFDNGGARLYVARVASTGAGGAVAAASDDLTGLAGTKFTARTAGSGGNGTLAFTVVAAPTTSAALAKSKPIGWVARIGSKDPITPPATTPTFTYFVSDSTGTFNRDGGGAALAAGDDVHGIEVLTVSATGTDADGNTTSYAEMGLDPAHPRYIGNVMAVNPARRSDQLTKTYAIVVPAAKPGAVALLNALIGAPTVTLKNGADGGAPTATDYSDALDGLRTIEDISIVAAPGSSDDDTLRQGVHNALIAHCEHRRAYRIAVLDTREVSTISEAADDRAPLDSTYAALYTPWVIVDNPLYKTGDASRPQEIAVPPSGAVCGVYARTDVNRGVFKAPANEVTLGVLRYDLDINFAQQETLNPAGINCLRTFPNRGNRVWGARTISSDPEWKYVPVRRYFNYLERSIDIGTQWAVFEPNGERLWANIRETISDFLVNEWRSGALLGTSPKEAFFVRCDRSTMDQNNLDNGQLICLIGVAVVKPAEFVIFRIGQKTADARS